MNIPSAKDFDSYIEKENQVKEDSIKYWTDHLVEKISFLISCGNYEVNGNKIKMRISGNYNNEKIINNVNQLFKEEGWKKVEVENDFDSGLFFSNITLIK